MKLISYLVGGNHWYRLKELQQTSGSHRWSRHPFGVAHRSLGNHLLAVDEIDRPFTFISPYWQRFKYIELSLLYLHIGRGLNIQNFHFYISILEVDEIYRTITFISPYWQGIKYIELSLLYLHIGGGLNIENYHFYISILEVD